MNIPLILQVSKAEEQVNLSRRLTIDDVQLADPFKMTTERNHWHRTLRTLFAVCSANNEVNILYKT
jgi:hypothetical protein